MLVSLSIRDVVLIERLDIPFEAGLSVLTGETGAGKSILLDSLGLALGARGDAGMIRAGAERLSVSAAFDPPAARNPAWEILKEQDLDAPTDEPWVLRRVIGRDGRGRAFVNDQPVAVALLRRIGDTLVEVHGQFDTVGLLNPATHRDILDQFGVPPEARARARETHAAWAAARDAVTEAEERLRRAQVEEDYLRHAANELSTLDPQPGEEDSLAERRRLLQHGGKLIEAIETAQTELGRAAHPLSAAARALERAQPSAGAMFDAVLEGIERGRIEIDEALAQLQPLAADIDLDPSQADRIEERLFSLRAVARKHGVQVDGLPALNAEFKARLHALDDGADGLAKLARAESQARQAFLGAAQALSVARTAAAKRLDATVAAELPPLKLEKARFLTEIVSDPDTAGPGGVDAVRFVVATNPGAAPGPLAKIASGGELARFMLALKVALAHADPVPTLVFDEVDAGIGGATAAAVGERLAMLTRDAQVLVVTHSPQVAALGHHHLMVKKDGVDAISTTVETLDADARLEEIARMLSGARLTDEARRAAAALLEGHR
jgi:DNA repair protein RecN (Recombination protein N)